ncbi:MAG: DUF7507 domain-containing protein, partial [Betaproteobacteria bacterium]
MATTPSPSVTTDLLDYLPGSTAVITAKNFLVGSTIAFQVSHVLDAGKDGKYGTLDDKLDTQTNATGGGHQKWYVTDGVRTAGADGLLGTADDGGDLDGVANGTIVTSWYVNPDDSFGSTFLLTASGINLGKDGKAGTKDDTSTGQVASTSFTDALPDPLDHNLVEADDGPESINDAVFEQFYQQPAGTGFIHSFVRVQSPGNDTNEQGYNTDHRPLEFDENSSPQFTRALLLANVPIVTVGEVEYREFLLDINEPNSKNEGFVSLDALQIYLGENGSLHGFTYGTGGTADNPEDGSFTSGDSLLVYDMDGDGNTSLALNADLSHGSGQSDIRVLIPDELFQDAELPYVYLYSAFGYEGGAYNAGGGFEEWALTGTPMSITIVKDAFDPFDENENPDQVFAFEIYGPNGFIQAFELDDDGDDGDGVFSSKTFSFTEFGEYTIVETPIPDFWDLTSVDLLEVDPINDPDTADTEIDPVADEVSITLTNGDAWTLTFKDEFTFNAQDVIIGIEKRTLDGTTTAGTVESDFTNNATDGAFILVGEEVTWIYQVTNPGTYDLSDVVVTDDQFGVTPTYLTGDDDDNVLEVGETWYYTATGTAEVDLYENTGTAEGTFNLVTAQFSDDSSYFGAAPELTVVKTNDGVEDQDANGEDAGDEINYSYTVTNTGNVTLFDV